LNNEINLLRGCQLPLLTVLPCHESMAWQLWPAVVLQFLLVNVAIAVGGNIVLHVSGDLTETVFLE
jgi:hypothetical protein